MYIRDNVEVHTRDLSVHARYMVITFKWYCYFTLLVLVLSPAPDGVRDKQVHTISNT